MEKDGSDFKENFLRLKVLLITAYDLAHADQNGMAKLEQLNKMLQPKDTRWLE
jgi:hypothetical protein